MAIAHYLKEIGRGREGARALTREQSCDLMSQILSQQVSQLELGGFCLAMRIKGETPEEMAGFLDAANLGMKPVVAAPGSAGKGVVVIPTYNGARRLPVLTPLLAMLLARSGFAVLMHGMATEDARVSSEQVMNLLDQNAILDPAAAIELQPGQLTFVHTSVLHSGLARLLEVRRVLGLRNSAHSMVKLINPVKASHGGAVVQLASFTHPEYSVSMSRTLCLTGSTALLLRGTEGECVADPRRMPQMRGLQAGHESVLQAAQDGPLAQLPDLPSTEAAECANYIRRVLNGSSPVPAPIARQVECVQQLAAGVSP